MGLENQIRVKSLTTRLNIFKVCGSAGFKQSKNWMQKNNFHTDVLDSNSNSNPKTDIFGVSEFMEA